MLPVTLFMWTKHRHTVQTAVALCLRKKGEFVMRAWAEMTCIKLILPVQPKEKMYAYKSNHTMETKSCPTASKHE